MVSSHRAAACAPVAQAMLAVATGRLWTKLFHNVLLASRVPSGRLPCRATAMHHAPHGRRRRRLRARRGSNCGMTERLFRIARAVLAAMAPTAQRTCRRAHHGARIIACATSGMSSTTPAMQRTIDLVLSAPRACIAPMTCLNVGAPRRCSLRVGSVVTRWRALVPKSSWRTAWL